MRTLCSRYLLSLVNLRPGFFLTPLAPPPPQHTHQSGRQEEDVKPEKNVFEIARDRVKFGVAEDDRKDAADSVTDKRTDILAPFMQFVQDPRRITKVGCDGSVYVLCCIEQAATVSE